MQNLNKVKEQIRKTIFEDKYLISMKTIENIKSAVFDVLKKYTKIKKQNININIKLSKKGTYLIEFKTEVFDIF